MGSGAKAKSTKVNSTILKLILCVGSESPLAPPFPIQTPVQRKSRQSLKSA